MSREAPAPPPRRALLFIFAAVFLDLLGAGLLLPIIPYYVRQFDKDALTVGLLALSFAAAQFLATPALGLVSDRIGRRPVLIFSVLGSGLAYLVFGMAHALWLLFVARIADGLTGGNISAAQAYIADVTTPHDRAKNMGLIGADVLCEKPLALSLEEADRIATAAREAKVVVAEAFMYRHHPQTTRLRELNPAKQVGAALRRPELRPFLLALFALNFALSGLQTNFPVFTLTRFGLGPEQNALIFTFLGVTAALMQGVAIRRLVKWFRAKPLAVTGLALMTGGLLVLAFSSALWMVYAAVATTAIGSGMATPTLTGAVSRSVSALEQGTILGASQAFTSLTRIFGPLWAGLAFDHAGPGAPYWTSAVVVFAAMVMIATSAGPEAVKP